MTQAASTLRSVLLLATLLSGLSACDRRTAPEVPPPAPTTGNPSTPSSMPEAPASSARM